MAMVERDFANELRDGMEGIDSPGEAWRKFATIVCDYLESAIDLTYTWSGGGALPGTPPVPSPDPVTMFTSKVTFTGRAAFVASNGPGWRGASDTAVSVFTRLNNLFKQLMTTAIMTNVTPGFTVGPPNVFLLAGTWIPMTIWQSGKNNRDEALLILAEQIIKMIKNPVLWDVTPKTGTHTPAPTVTGTWIAPFPASVPPGIGGILTSVL